MLTVVAVPKSIFAGCFDPSDVKRLQSKVKLLPENPFDDLPEEVTGEWLAERIAPAEVLITGWETPPLTEEILDRAKALRAIVHSAGSIKLLVPPSVFERGIAVTNVRHALAVGVAESTLAMIIASAKMFVPLDRVIEKGQWRGSSWHEWVLEPYQITVGIIGAGEVGKHLLSLLKMFEVRKVIYDPYVGEDVVESLGAEKLGLDELCSASDVIAICAPATEETYHLIGRKQFGLMKERVRLINTARGSIIDQEALIGELSKGKMYAFLDVTDPEPPAEDSPLRSSPYCTLTPHLAGHYSNGQKRQGRLVVEEILGFLDEGRFKWQVTAESFSRQA